jgi:hypothetical protein
MLIDEARKKHSNLIKKYKEIERRTAFDVLTKILEISVNGVPIISGNLRNSAKISKADLTLTYGIKYAHRRYYQNSSGVVKWVEVAINLNRSNLIAFAQQQTDKAMQALI